MDTYLLKFENWMTLKNYAKKTHKSYSCSVRQFWGFCEGQAGKEGFSKDNAVDFFCCTASMSSRSVGKRSTAIIRRCAYFRQFPLIKCLIYYWELPYVHILDRKWDLRKLPRPRKQKTLPKVIGPEKVQLLIDNGVCFKHKVFMTLLYSTGLRLSEALRLRVEDVDAAAMSLRVLDGKGHKDRYTLLSAECLDMLRFYFRAYRPEGGLIFNGRDISKKKNTGNLGIRGYRFYGKS
ncbi:MAG: site-specific recombinase XerD [Paraglaciecola sp.]|jgi:site-specific recombinase XerD